MILVGVVSLVIVRFSVLKCDIRVSGVLARILADKSADVINLKISKVGGLTRARAIRDLAVSAGIPMNIEDTWLVKILISLFGKVV
jgi:hypothetical protein